MDFLIAGSGFLSPVVKAQDDHYINPIHLLQYFDQFKIPGYDFHCSSLDKETYSQLCCSICNKYYPTLIYLTKHKCLQHPSNCGRPKKALKISKTNSATFDNFIALPLQNITRILS
ncbi:34912_t:CDS:1, partial [Gigaspora margarita]